MNHSGSPGIRAVDVWDVLITSITTVGSIGELLDDYASLECFEIAESVGAGVSYTPPANCVITGYEVTNALLKLQVQDYANNWRSSILVPTQDAYNQDIVACDGVSVRFNNSSGGALTMTAEAWRYA